MSFLRNPRLLYLRIPGPRGIGDLSRWEGVAEIMACTNFFCMGLGVGAVGVGYRVGGLG